MQHVHVTHVKYPSIQTQQQQQQQQDRDPERKVATPSMDTMKHLTGGTMGNKGDMWVYLQLRNLQTLESPK